MVPMTLPRGPSASTVKAEWKVPGQGETLEGNHDGQRQIVGGNTFVVVEAEGDDLVHSDGETAKKAANCLQSVQNGKTVLSERKLCSFMYRLCFQNIVTLSALLK